MEDCRRSQLAQKMMARKRDLIFCPGCLDNWDWKGLWVPMYNSDFHFVSRYRELELETEKNAKT